MISFALLFLLSCFAPGLGYVPWINCPGDLYKILPTGKSTTSFGSKWKLPKTDDKFTVTVSPAGADGQYQFPAGNTRVTWTATNSVGKTDSCIQHVNIEDKEAPKIVYCPGPTVFHAAYKAPPYYVQYKTPIFTDNVGIDKVQTTFVKHKFDHMGSFNQYFTAYDKARNKAECKFVVEIGGTKCTWWPDKRGLPGTWSYLSFGKPFSSRTVMRQCPSGLTDSNGGYGIYRCDKATGEWSPKRVGDCVPSTWMKDNACPSGFAKKRIGTSNFFMCLQCGRGAYLKGGSCHLCSAGTYQDKTTPQYSCGACPAGTSSLEGDFKCRDLCPVGTYSKDGMKPFCHLCPEGHFQDKQGQTSCNVCPGNKFTNTKLGSTSCEDVKPSSQPQKGMLEISSIVKPKEWNWHSTSPDVNDTLECRIKDNSFNPVAVYWKVTDKPNIPADFLGKLKFKEITNDAGKVIGSRLIVFYSTRHNAELEYTCVAENVNGETRKTVKIPWLKL